MISISVSGRSDKTEAYLKRLANNEIYKNLKDYAEEGVRALSAATPRDSGLTAMSWSAEVYRTKDSWRVVWMNSNRPDGAPLAIMLQYGYATGTGGYVQGEDYINPTIKPIFKKIQDAVWREVTRA